ncbi:MAG: folA 2, partial [Nocardioides sp.]|nr:folA 2 [Nocardioides sp.]
MTRTIFYTATTLDGYLADEHDSLDWLFTQELDEDGPMNYGQFIKTVGAMAMGATTYAWIGEHLARTGEPWTYDVPCWVFTHREFEP